MTKPGVPCKLARDLSVEPQKNAGWRQWWRWAFAVVPAAGTLELAAHAVQIHSVVPDRDWQAAKAYVGANVRPEDLVAFAPRWADPIGRHFFGSGLATLEREARADESRFPRAFEVSIRGAHSPELSGWRRSGVMGFGGVTVTTLENPSAVHVLDDLVSRVERQNVVVTRVDGERESDCPLSRGSVQTGGLGFGTPIPADRFLCGPGGFVGVSLVEDSAYRPHRCIDALPLGGSSVLRLRFSGIQMGRTLRGHHTLYVEAEHAGKAPVSIAFVMGNSVLGRAVHRDGDGWTSFEFDTSEWLGRSADLVVNIESSTSERRMYCFEAVTQ